MKVKYDLNEETFDVVNIDEMEVKNETYIFADDDSWVIRIRDESITLEDDINRTNIRVTESAGVEVFRGELSEEYSEMLNDLVSKLNWSLFQEIN